MVQETGYHTRRAFRAALVFFMFLLVFFLLKLILFRVICLKLILFMLFFLRLCRIEFVGAAALNWRNAARVIFYRASSLQLGPGLFRFFFIIFFVMAGFWYFGNQLLYYFSFR